MPSSLETIQEYAARAHQGQMRKFKVEPYIAHPIRVMQLCAQYSTDACIHYAALLHDVLEDTAVKTVELREWLHTVLPAAEADRTWKLVKELTDVYTREAYPRLNRRERKKKETQRLAASSAEAQTVKYADIIDNCRGFAATGSDFAPVFLRECQHLLPHLNKGNAALYQLAKEVIEKELKELRK